MITFLFIRNKVPKMFRNEMMMANIFSTKNGKVGIQKSKSEWTKKLEPMSKPTNLILKQAPSSSKLFYEHSPTMKRTVVCSALQTTSFCGRPKGTKLGHPDSGAIPTESRNPHRNKSHILCVLRFL